MSQDFWQISNKKLPFKIIYCIIRNKNILKFNSKIICFINCIRKLQGPVFFYQGELDYILLYKNTDLIYNYKWFKLI